MTRKYGKKASEKIARVMREFEKGTLKSHGRKVTSREQAIAIGISEARARGYKVPPEPKRQHSTRKKLDEAFQAHLSHHVDNEVRRYLGYMRPGQEIDAQGLARALHIEPLEADYALQRAARDGAAVTEDGRWFGPAGSTRHHSSMRKPRRGAAAASARRAALGQQPLRAAGIRTFSDTGQTQAYVVWADGSETAGSPDNPHMQALLARAKREGVRVRLGEVF